MFSGVLAGGTESMSACPMLSDGAPLFQNPDLTEQTGNLPIASAADLLAHKLNIGASELDDISLRSHALAGSSVKERHHPENLTPVYNLKTGMTVREDNGCRPDLSKSDLEAMPPVMQGLQQKWPERSLKKHPELASVRPVHTKAHAPLVADGSGILVLGDQSLGEKLNKKPVAEILSCVTATADPVLMLTAPALAAVKALKEAGISMKNIDLFEVNEGFAVSIAAFRRMTGVPEKVLNTWGGAIALGHPLGATGAILLAHLLENLRGRGLQRGLVAIPGAGGSGAACIVQLCD